MRNWTAHYVVPQLPRVLMFPLIAPGISARFDLPLTLLVLVGLPVMVVGFAVLAQLVAWLKAALLEIDAE